MIATDFRTATVIAIFAATYLGMALGRLPFLRIDRTGIALVGASFMIGAGAIGLDDALKSVDLNIIALLLGMMVVVAHLRIAGFFRLAGAFAVARAATPLSLLCAIVGVTGILSAFLVNDAVCLIMAPLVIDVVRRLDRNPVPYLLATAMASNAGSAATITGNPQNMVIGLDAHLTYADFAARLAPPALFAMLLTIPLVAMGFRREFATPFEVQALAMPTHWHKGQLLKALAISVSVIVAFFLKVPMAEAAVIGASLAFLTRSVKAHKLYSQIDGGLLLMFAGLFIVTAAAQRVLLYADVLSVVGALHLENVWNLSAVTAALSNIVSNVPAVLLLRPFVEKLPAADQAWRIVAMSSTFAGNLTLLGSVANLIIAERAKADGIKISFFAYFKIGLPLTLLSLIAGTWWLAR